MMYIESCHYQFLPKRLPKERRARYQQYYEDLHQRYGLNLDTDTLLQGSQYAFNQMSEPLFAALKEDGVFPHIDLMAVASWAHECDPDYATLGPYLAHHY